jgi:tetratricopeptide (TPR) repeat protein
MRFYKRTRDDKLNTGLRSLAEAERGQIHLALERLKDLAEACLLELLLAIKPSMELTKEVEARRLRAEALRELDRKAMTQRKASLNLPMPDERMTLKEGLHELEQALELDPYDAEMWNFRSAWCILLKRYEEAIPHAERALIIRPHGYVKPLINKSTALGYLGRHDESAAVAQEAIDRATNAADRSLARTVLADFRQPPAPLTPPAIQALSQVAWDESRNTANNELGAQSGGASRLAAGILERVHPAGADAGMLAELLNDFFPETVFVAVSEADRTSPGLRRRFADTAQHLLAHANEVVRRDAARFLALAILRAGNAAAIRGEFRRLSSEFSGSTMEATEAMDPLMHRVLQSFHSRLPAFLEGQEPIEDEGPIEDDKLIENEGSRAGCSTVVGAMVLGAVVVIVVLIFSC